MCQYAFCEKIKNYDIISHPPFIAVYIVFFEGVGDTDRRGCFRFIAERCGAAGLRSARRWAMRSASRFDLATGGNTDRLGWKNSAVAGRLVRRRAPRDVSGFPSFTIQSTRPLGLDSICE
jgi:hypothetical protein